MVHRFAMIVLLGALTAGHAGAQAAATQPAEARALYSLEDDFARAVVRRDANALRRLTSPRWVYSDESGVMEREAGIRAFTTGTDTVREAGNEQMRAIMHGRTAVVVGILRLVGRGPKGPFTRRYRYTDTWLEVDGHWQCIASQDYLLPPTRP